MRKLISVLFLFAFFSVSCDLPFEEKGDEPDLQKTKSTAYGPEVTTPNVSNPTRVPENAVEIVQKRNAYSKIYDNLDGTFTGVVYTVPIHRKNQGGSWEEIDTFTGAEKIATDQITYASLTANPQYLYSASPPYYGDVCPENKLGEEEGATEATSRVLPEFDLSSPDGVATVTAATIYYTPRDTTSLTTLAITTYIGIDYRPSLMRTLGYHQTNFDNCANPLYSYLSLSAGEKNYGLGSYERGKIKDRCNAGDEDDEWYAVGYKLNNEACSSRLWDNCNKLIFTYTQ